MIILSSFLFFLLMYFYFLIGFSQGLAAKVLGKTYPKALYFKIHMKKSACGSNSYYLDFYKTKKSIVCTTIHILFNLEHFRTFMSASA